MRRVVAAALALFVSASGCAREAVPPPAAPASLASSGDAIPADLDLVIRIDVRRIREGLGEAIWQELRDKATEAGQQGDAGTEKFVAQALAKANVVYIAVRPALAAKGLDNVLVLEGDFAGLDPRRQGSEPAWQPAVDLGATWRRYDRVRPPARAAPARIYAHGNDKLVCVSEAEIDSAERALELGKRDEALKVPAHGVIAVAARLPAILPRLLEKAPTFAAVLEGARELDASADVTTTGLKIAAAFKFQGEAQASRFSDACKRLAERLAGVRGPVGSIAQSTRVEALGADVTLRVAVDRSAFGEIMACAAGPGCL